MIAAVLVMHGVVPHFHHEHRNEAETQVVHINDGTVIGLLSQVFHQSHNQNDLEQLQLVQESADVPPLALLLLADWNTTVTVDVAAKQRPVASPSHEAILSHLFLGSLIISRPPPVC